MGLRGIPKVDTAPGVHIQTHKCPCEKRQVPRPPSFPAIHGHKVALHGAREEAHSKLQSPRRLRDTCTVHLERTPGTQKRILTGARLVQTQADVVGCGVAPKTPGDAHYGVVRGWGGFFLGCCRHSAETFWIVGGPYPAAAEMRVAIGRPRNPLPPASDHQVFLRHVF